MSVFIGVDYGGDGGGHVPTTIYNLNFVPTTFKNVQTNCDQKIPTYSTDAHVRMHTGSQGRAGHREVRKISRTAGQP